MRAGLYPGSALLGLTRRSVYTTVSRQRQCRRTNSTKVPVEGATEISHSHFISSASPKSDFNPTQQPTAGQEEENLHRKWQGRLSPTTSHLFKLVLPLPRSDLDDHPQPTAFLLHPSQPLSHLSRLISGSLPPDQRDVEIQYLALTGQESDLDSHLRNAQEEQDEDGDDTTTRQEGGPFLHERQGGKGRWQEVSWSQSTDLSDFIKQSCLNEKFKILIQRQPVGRSGHNRGNNELVLEVVIPSFDSRTKYLRKRLLSLTKDLDEMTRQKKSIDVQAHKGARKLIVAGLVVGAGYWIAVVRWTFYTPDVGWDTMEPVTWCVGFGSLLASAAFLAYHNREVSYSSILDLSVTARQRTLYEKHGLNIDHWTEMVAEAKTLRKEIQRIASDYDIEWKGELENLQGSLRDQAFGKRNGIDIDKTIDEADELASRTEEQREKERAAQRKGQVDTAIPSGGSHSNGKKSNVERGVEKAKKLVDGG